MLVMGRRVYQSWSRTLGVVRGLTSFKRMTKRRKRKDEKQVLWRKLALRMKILNILSTKHYRMQRETVALRKLKKRLGKYCPEKLCLELIEPLVILIKEKN